MDPTTRRQRIEQHLDAIRQLEAEPEAAAEPGAARAWPPEGYYLLWHLVVGATLGALGAFVSLLANALGAPLFGRQPFELIRVFLTFPMGERALAADAGLVLGVGVFLYMVTGALFGILFHLIFSVWFPNVTTGRRFLIATGLGLGLWIFNFYLVLSWLQPMLLDGNWIVRSVPIWVGALTHLAFAWTIALGEAWGRFEPARGAAA
jgi:hypothetical protein